MQSAALPANEPYRLRALYQYDILDTEPEDVFNELAELAANICESPIALVSLVDESRQWFKARIGLAATETARAVSFCAHAILQENLFVVPDTLNDTRFADNPLVTGPPNIRFYAGAPLFSPEGFGLGTLCVIDSRPRQLSPAQQRSLMVLRTHVLKLLELRAKSRELRDLNRELEAYSYAVSHDLRAPVRAVLGFSDILRQEHAEVLGAPALELVGRIHNAAARMQHLIEDLLYLSRVSRSHLELTDVNLSLLAREILSDLQQADPGRRVDIHVEPGLVAKADPRLLHIALENLLSNAWKYTAKNPAARIEVGRDPAQDRANFFVRDNGIGFDMAYAGRLFQPFQRLHADPDFVGTGIGLATVRRLVQRHGGRIWVEAAVNQGATFHFTLLPEGAGKTHHMNGAPRP